MKKSKHTKNISLIDLGRPHQIYINRLMIKLKGLTIEEIKQLAKNETAE